MTPKLNNQGNNRSKQEKVSIPETGNYDASNRPIDWGEKIRDIHLILVAVIVVLSLGFIQTAATVVGLVIDSYRFKASTYQSLIDKIDAQNEKLNSIYEHQANEKSQLFSQPPQNSVPTPAVPEPAGQGN